jgi:hypothetical protein
VSNVLDYFVWFDFRQFAFNENNEVIREQVVSRFFVEFVKYQPFLIPMRFLRRQNSCKPRTRWTLNITVTFICCFCAVKLLKTPKFLLYHNLVGYKHLPFLFLRCRCPCGHNTCRHIPVWSKSEHDSVENSFIKSLHIKRHAYYKYFIRI